MYESTSLGGSHCTTKSTSGMSRPLNNFLIFANKPVHNYKKAKPTNMKKLNNDNYNNNYKTTLLKRNTTHVERGSTK
jgi:hypothetical protein